MVKCTERESAAAKLLNSLNGGRTAKSLRFLRIRRGKETKCDICNYICISGADRERHFNAKHPFQKPYPCPDNCGERFSSKEGARKHKVSCNKVPKEIRESLMSKCELCGKRYIKSADLNLHMKREHTEAYEKQYECEDCGKRFANKPNLNKHKRKQVCFSIVDGFKIKASANNFELGGTLENDVPDGVYEHELFKPCNQRGVQI